MNSKFVCCPKANYLCDGYFEFCDTPPQNNDCHHCGPYDKPYVYCWPCITPIALFIDYISFPCRFYSFKKNKKQNEIQIV